MKRAVIGATAAYLIVWLILTAFPHTSLFYAWLAAFPSRPWDMWAGTMLAALLILAGVLYRPGDFRIRRKSAALVLVACVLIGGCGTAAWPFASQTCAQCNPHLVRTQPRAEEALLHKVVIDFEGTASEAGRWSYPPPHIAEFKRSVDGYVADAKRAIQNGEWSSVTVNIANIEHLRTIIANRSECRGGQVHRITQSAPNQPIQVTCGPRED